MAEIIKDTYSLEFDAAGFESQISEAIAKVEELQGAMEDTAGSTEELDGALASLEDILKKDAKGVEELNSKQKVLATTQKNVNKESAAYGPIAKENAKNQKQLATATADATKNQKSLGGSVLDGAKKLNSLKRAAGLVTGAFRLLGAFNPVGLAITGITLLAGLFTSFIGTTAKAKTALEQLNDPSLTGERRLEIIKEELERLKDVEGAVGKLTDEEKQQRDELSKKYKETSAEIIKIEEERAERLNELQTKAARLRVKLLGDTAGAAQENYKLELKVLANEFDKNFNRITRRVREIQEEIRLGTINTSDAEKELQTLADEQALLFEVYDAEQKTLEKQQIESIQRIANEQKQAREREAAEIKKAEENKKKEAEDREARRVANVRKFNEKLAKEIAEEDAELQRQADELKYLNSLEYAQKTANDINAVRLEFSEQEQRFIEIASQKQILALEQERNAALLNAKKTATSQEQLNAELERIDKQYSQKRTALDAKATAEIAKARIKILEEVIARAQVVGIDTTAAQKELEDLKLKIVELENAALIKVDADTEPAENKLKELAKELLPLFQTVSDEIFGLLAQQASFLTERLDKAVEKSKSALDEIRNNSEDFNAQQLAEEKRRLQDLEAARRQAAQRERIIAQVQIAANAAIAISKAAAEGGVAAPFTIAATLISLIAGFAAARNAASGAFFHGTEYLERNGAPKGKDTIHIRAHEGERIVPTANNMKYWDAYSAFQNEKIPAEIANLFAKGYLSGGLHGAVGALGAPKLEGVNLRQKLGSNVVYIMQGATMETAKLEKAINEVSEQLSDLPKKMPVSTFNVNSHGLYMSTKKYIGRQEMRKGRAK